jgi:hypothetical protein
MNANEATGTRELAEMNGGSRELTLDEVNMVTGGVPRVGFFHFVIGTFSFRGDATGGCVTWGTPNGGRMGLCW